MKSSEVVKSSKKTEVAAEPDKGRDVPEHMRCPVCWGGLKGEGKHYGQHQKGAMTRHYLRCNACGHTWTADTKIDVVAIDHRLPENLSAR